MEIINKNRIYWLDALRGIAVILMIQQHLGFWLWEETSSMLKLLSTHPLMVSCNALGGLAAPLFVLLAGAGSACYFFKHKKPTKQLLIRGLLVLLSGYLLNACVPSWFSMGSWYVLHLIGFCFVITPLLRKIPVRNLTIIAVLTIVIALILQSILDTPRSMGNNRMSDYSLPGGIFRLAFVEGHFPVFPWLAMYIAGFIVGKFWIENRIKRIIRFGVILLITSVMLSLGYVTIYPFIKSDLLARLFRFVPAFYPALAPIIIFLTACALFLFLFMYWLNQKKSFSHKNPLVSLGRVSLTLLIVHAVLFKQLSIMLGFWKVFSTPVTALLIILILGLFAMLAKLWSAYDYKFSLEWIIRKCAS